MNGRIAGWLNLRRRAAGCDSITSLKDIPPDGTNDATRELANEKVFQAWSQRIHDELLRRARAAAGATPTP